jgi:DNA-binding transcriptional MerR regulator
MSAKTGQMPEETDSKFKIGAVSRITQIPVDTLRAWERRYQVVSPQRTGSAARLYDGEDVERLKLIKRLVAAGHAISSIANLSRHELADLTRLHVTIDQRAEFSTDATIVNAVVFSEMRESLPLSDAANADPVEVIAQCRSWPEFETNVLRESPDALVIDIAALLRNRAHQIVKLHTQSGAQRTIVIYSFAPTVVLAELAREGIITLRSPLDPLQLSRELTRSLTHRPLAHEPLPDAPVPRLFDNAMLETLANLTPALQCECPHHLVDIVRTLTQFETYSAECEHRDDEDAALHAKLRMTTAAARGIFEQALIEVAEHEGIALPDSLRALTQPSD